MKTLTPSRLMPVAVLAAIAALAGCESTKLAEPVAKVPVETRSALTPDASAPTGASATTAGTPQSRVATVDLPSAGAGAGGAASTAMPGQRIVYFDFDSYAIKDDYKPVIEGFGRALAAQRAKKLTVEGHTDERGGREYNLALGQKRAESVARSLKLLGAGDGQIEAVSFGEERPAASGATETAFSQNRRAELKDR